MGRNPRQNNSDHATSSSDQQAAVPPAYLPQGGICLPNDSLVGRHGERPASSDSSAGVTPTASGGMCLPNDNQTGRRGEQPAYSDSSAVADPAASGGMCLPNGPYQDGRTGERPSDNYRPTDSPRRVILSPEKAQQIIPGEDYKYEMMANAYRRGNENLEHLRGAHYRLNRVIREDGSGFGMRSFLPSNNVEHRRPVLAFDGTDGLLMKDWIYNTDHAGIGTYPFYANISAIRQELERLSALSPDGKIDVTGHSLGGVDAQMAKCEFSALVGKVKTFQSPGIPEWLLRDSPRSSAESTHYRARGDIVSTVGQKWTPGTFYEFELDHSGLLTGVLEHSGGVIGILEREYALHTASLLAELAGKGEPDTVVKQVEIYQTTSAPNERLRHIAGTILHDIPVDRGAPGRGYTEMWRPIYENALTHNQQHIIDLITHSRTLIIEDKVIMLMNLARMYQNEYRSAVGEPVKHQITALATQSSASIAQRIESLERLSTMFSELRQMNAPLLEDLRRQFDLEMRYRGLTPP